MLPFCFKHSCARKRFRSSYSNHNPPAVLLHILKQPALSAKAAGQGMDHLDSDDQSEMHNCKEDPWAPSYVKMQEDSDIFANCKSWQVKGRANRGDIFIPLCGPKVYDGCSMIPVFGGGAIQADFVQRVACTAINPNIVVIHIGKKAPKRTRTRSRRGAFCMHRESPFGARRFGNVCLVDTFRALGIKVPYRSDGPHWVLADGSHMLQPHGYTVKPVARVHSTSVGRFALCRGDHAVALKCHADGDVWMVDGKDSCRVEAKDLDSLLKGTKIFQVLPSNVRTSPQVNMPQRQQPKLPVAVCIQINKFLAPDQWPELIHTVAEGGPVTYPLFGAEGLADFLRPFMPGDVYVGARSAQEHEDTAASGGEELQNMQVASQELEYAEEIQDMEGVAGDADKSLPTRAAADVSLHEPLRGEQRFGIAGYLLGLRRESAGAATAPPDVSPSVPRTHAHFETFDDLSQATPVEKCMTVQIGNHDEPPEDLAALQGAELRQLRTKGDGACAVHACFGHANNTSSADEVACNEPRELLADILPADVRALLAQVRPEKQQEVRDMMAGVWSDALLPYVKPSGAVDEAGASPEERAFLQVVRKPSHMQLWRDIVHQLVTNESKKAALHKLKK